MFCSKGYEAVTIDDVAAHAGYSRMPIYSLFGDKQNLFFALWRRAIAEMMETLMAGLERGVPLRDNLRRLAEAAAQSRPFAPGAAEQLFFVVQTIALSRPEIEDELQALSRTVIGRFAAMVADSTLAKGEQLRATPDTIAAHLVAHINGMSTVQFQTGRGYVNVDDLVAIFTAIALKR
ncbi:TetR/AcrR family transcriptional regulator [Solimonas sp. C16B3]|uniref:TetR/AcrR family transcriptional regulator n=2 Tax=Solimonas marina TaxID=2714601 RepID=A0A969WAG5_9GAMM|nr:TetR/AcrR family transcriptional regulator [Solimonas marina]